MKSNWEANILSYGTIDGLMFKEMIIAGAALLEKNREAVDALNVFPVPDGDTGTNMSLTLKSTVKEIGAVENTSAAQMAELVARGALKGARGNSGVITSQILRGIAKGLDGAQVITPVLFARALKSGADTAYKAVMKPKEGTILTVIRVIAEEAQRHVQKNPDDINALLGVVVQSGEAILKKTPEMLPVLKQAGVVDSGGQGLLTIFTGMRMAYNGEHIEDSAMEVGQAANLEFEDDHDSLEELTYKYCTEFIIQEMLPTVTEDDINRFRTKLTRIGDCVVVVGDFSLVKVHVHTNDPGLALQYACAMGELVNLKIDNMAEERRERQIKNEQLQKAAEEARRQSEPQQEYGMVAVSLGEGFSQIFTDLGVNEIVEGGQTMNPSIEDIYDAIERVNARTVFVLPNNGNVVMAANQAAEMSEKDVRVIPTKNVAMGIGAVIAFVADCTPDDNFESMNEAAQRVKTGQITFAVRDTTFEDKIIKEGDIIGIYNGKIQCVGQSVHDVALELMKVLVTDEDELVTVYYGADTREEDAQALTDEIGGMFDDKDVEMQYGGQPLYYYLISAE